jgi:hypothetical protein
MEDLKREFEGEPANPAPTHETRPPKRPEKLLPDEPTEASTTLVAEDEDMSYSPVLSNDNARRSSAALPTPESDDEAMSDSNAMPGQWDFVVRPIQQ